jgi:predicted nucleotidyltransferase
MDFIDDQPDTQTRESTEEDHQMSTDQMATVVALIRDVLPDAVLGVYLHGSAVFGTLKPTSDLDLFVVTSRRTTEAERRALIDRLLPVSGRGDPSGRSRSVNFEIVAQADVRPWHYPAWLDFQFGDWYRPDFAKGDYAPWDSASPDLAIVLAMVLRANRALSGPPPAELFGPIPWGDVRQAMLDSIPDLLSYLDGDERNVVLTFARIWTTLATGQFRSKEGAADWAIPLLPEEHRAVLARARSLYVRGIPTEDWGDLLPRVRPFVDYVIGEIQTTAASDPATA